MKQNIAQQHARQHICIMLSCQSTGGGWLVIQSGRSLTRLTSPYYSNATCMQI